MQDNRKLIIEEFESLKGQFVIAGDWKVKRLVGVVEDDMDYYWLLYDGRKFSLDSCVSRVVPLKGKLDNMDYNEFVRLAYLNHFDIIGYYCREEDKEEGMRVSENHKREITEDLLREGENQNYLLTEICWELNKI
jgi:hypothetical protein